MKVDFETLAAVISLAINAAGVTTLALLLADKNFIVPFEELSGAVKTKLSDRGFVLRSSREFGKKIFSPLVVLLHLIDILVFLALYFILIAGPENIHPALFSGSLAEPLTLLEKIIYATALTLFFLAYLSRCIVPTTKYWIVYRKTKDWLKQNEPHKPVTG